jgi:tetratricopeptide (TPR) repeat protein
MNLSSSAADAGTPPVVASLDLRLAGLTEATAQALRAARAALDRRDPETADRALVQTGGSAALHPEYLRLLGIVRHLQKRPREAIAALRQALELVPGDALILINLGSALRAAGERDAALASLRRACELAPDLAAAWYNLGRMLGALRRPAEAHEAFERALHCDPAHTQARLHYAGTLRTFGRIEEAVAEYRKILDSEGSIDAWSRLAGIKTLRLTATDCAELERLFAQPALAADDRVKAGFALVKALEDCGRYSEAFATMATTNALHRRRVEWDSAAWHARTQRMLQAFSKAPASASAATFGREVIFIVSVPRSGSTLTEQILASHPEVEGASELPDLGDVIEAESTRRGIAFPDWTAQATPADWRRLGEDYLERTARWRRERPRFTDKALDNWRYLGAAMAMLPGAHFIDCRRDPVETCLSCYRQLFASGQGFTYDIGDLAMFWRHYDQAMRFWSTRYPAAIRTQVYEKLVADPESEIRALLEFCQLPFDPACMRPHEATRAVRTLSAAQVRQPLRSDTARAWRYGDLLTPLRSALGAS